MILKPARLLLAMTAMVAMPAFAQNVATVNGKPIPAAKVDQLVNHARHILVGTEEEAKAIIAKLKGGAKFEELAKQSKDGSAANGGDLDWASPATFVPEFSKAMTSLQKGAITETPVKTQFGYHVIKLEDTRAAKIPALEEVKQQVAEQLQQRQLAQYRESLVKKAKVQ